MIRLLLLTALFAFAGAPLCGADAFDTPELKKAQADLQAAEQRYLAVFKDALAKSGLTPVPVPALPNDPRQSEREKRDAALEVNRRLVVLHAVLKKYEVDVAKEWTTFLTRALIEDARRIAEARESLVGVAQVKQDDQSKPKLKATLADGTIVESP